MKKNDKPQRKRLVLSRETMRGLNRELGAEELRQAAGGTCYTDVRISQCCPAA
jgi:hypothetical protein